MKRFPYYEDSYASPISSFADVIDALANLAEPSQAQDRMDERVWQAEENIKEREFQKKMMEGEVSLKLLADDYRLQRERLSTLEDALSAEGFQLPETDQTLGFGDVKDHTKEGYETALKNTLTKIANVNKEMSLIQAGRDFIKVQEDLYGSLIAAGKDEAWKDFMLEGNISYDPKKDKGKQFTGTDEMAKWLNKLDDAQLEQLKNENFRQAVLRGRKNVQEAQEAAAARQQYDANKLAISFTNLEIKKAQAEIREDKYDAGMKRFDNAEQDINDRIFGLGKSVLSDLNLEGYGVNYLTMLEEPDKYEDIMEQFIENNPEIAQEVRSIIDNFSLSVQVGADWSEPVLRAQTSAYSDFLEARSIEETLGNGDSSKGIAAIKKLPFGDPTRSRYTYLEKRIEGFKKAGLYGSGRNVEEMEANLVNAFQLIKAKDQLISDKASADIEYLGNIANKGYPIELEDFSPKSYKDMSDADRQDLLVSIELLRSMKDPVGTDPVDAKLLIRRLTEKIVILESLGLTNLDEYRNLVEKLQSTEFDFNKEVNRRAIEEVNAEIDAKLTKVAETTGIKKEVLEKASKSSERALTPWGTNRRYRSSSGKFF
jgi:hypothetical protein|tara:strand:+ start:42 stop:1835 length:1794 start_codon:yes stop_codon:yes gene_type:complete